MDSDCVASSGSVAGAGPVSAATVEGDFVPFPPARRQAVSPNGRYTLLVVSRDEWRSKRATAQLLEAGRIIWERELPQEHGPRYFLVGNDGQAVLFDEWANVKSRHAIMLIDSRRKLERVYPFDAVAAILETPVRAIVERAKGGWWLEGPPSLDATHQVVLAATAGRCLVLDLRTGDISAPRPWPPSCRQPG
ncbi:MAG TPA: hypothetical protein VKF40_03380 [Burkholderiales bacterium]|nr:hypothetical protein [Burkholderiales bacterium]